MLGSGWVGSKPDLAGWVAALKLLYVHEHARMAMWAYDWMSLLELDSKWSNIHVYIEEKEENAYVYVDGLKNSIVW